MLAMGAHCLLSMLLALYLLRTGWDKQWHLGIALLVNLIPAVLVAYLLQEFMASFFEMQRIAIATIADHEGNVSPGMLVYFALGTLAAASVGWRTYDRKIHS